MIVWVIVSLSASILLGVITLVWSLMRLRRDKVEGRDWLGVGLISVAAVLDVVALGVSLLGIEKEAWGIIRSHTDGLLLITILLSLLVIYIKLKGRLNGLDIFALIAMIFFGLWAVCSSTFTYRPFESSPLRVFHLLTVYLGSLSVTVAGAAGGCYLYVQRSLKSRKDPIMRLKQMSRLGNLESVEKVMTTAAALSFCCLALSLTTGAFLFAADSPPEVLDYIKITLTFAVWLMFALIMHVRLAPSLRGRRAAMLSITGFVLILVTMSVAVIQVAVKFGSQDSAAQVDVVQTQSVEGKS